MRITKDDWIMIGFASAVTALVVIFFWWAIWLINSDAKAWKAFTAEHVCERTQHTKPGYYSNIYVNKMLIMSWVPGQVLYQCDDGNGYWRDQ